MADFFTAHMKFDHRLEGLVNAFSDDLAKTLEGVLETVEGRIAVLGAKAEETPSLVRRKKYLEKQKEEIEKVLSEVYSNIETEIKSKVVETAQGTPGIIHRIIFESLPKGIEIRLGVPSLSKKQVILWFETSQIEGAFFSDWVKKLERNAVDRIVAESRRALILHEPQAKAAKRLQDALNVGRHSASALLNTALQEAVNWAELQYYYENSKNIPKVRFVAELDRRTTPICRTKDGEIYPIEEAHIHKPPLHMRCRSRLWPVFEGFDPAEIKGAKRTSRIETDPRTIKHRDGTTSTAYREFDAKLVRANMTYNDWMKSMVFSNNPRDVAFAREALGRTRFNLVKSEKLKMESLYYGGKLRTIKELEKLN